MSHIEELLSSISALQIQDEPHGLSAAMEMPSDIIDIGDDATSSAQLDTSADRLRIVEDSAALYPSIALAHKSARLRRLPVTMRDIVTSRGKRELQRGARLRHSLKSVGFAVLMLVRMQQAIENNRRLAKLRGITSRRNSGSASASRRTTARKSELAEMPRAVDEEKDAKSEDSDDWDDDVESQLNNNSLFGMESAAADTAAAQDSVRLKIGGEGRFFPSAKELDDYPELLVNHVLNSAARVLARCILILRLRRSLARRRLKRKRVSPLVFKGSLEGTCFDGWPSDAMESLFEQGYLERRNAGDFLYYCGEDARHVTFVLDGNLMAVKRADYTVKPVSTSHHNGASTEPIKTPCILRETAVFVEEEQREAVEATSMVDVVVIPISVVHSVFESLDPTVRTTVRNREVDRRKRYIRATTPDLGAVVRRSPLFDALSEAQTAAIGALMEPRAFFQGTTVHDREEDPSEIMYFVHRGTINGVTSYRDPTGDWRDLIFAVWNPMDTFGEKSLYFHEKHIFSAVAATNTDVWALRRGPLLSLLANDRQLKQDLADGALSIRRRDAAVRLRPFMVRNIPCFKAALTYGVLSDAHLRKIHDMFRFRIFPQNELITSASIVVTEMVILMTGTAVADSLSSTAFIVPNGVAFGTSGIVPRRWRFATQAVTTCEGWVLDLKELCSFLDELGVRPQLSAFAHQNHQMVLHGPDADREMTLATPQHLYGDEPIRPKLQRGPKKVRPKLFFDRSYRAGPPLATSSKMSAQMLPHLPLMDSSMATRVAKQLLTDGATIESSPPRLGITVASRNASPDASFRRVESRSDGTSSGSLRVKAPSFLVRRSVEISLGDEILPLADRGDPLQNSGRRLDRDSSGERSPTNSSLGAKHPSWRSQRPPNTHLTTQGSFAASSRRISTQSEDLNLAPAIAENNKGKPKAKKMSVAGDIDRPSSAMVMRDIRNKRMEEYLLAQGKDIANPLSRPQSTQSTARKPPTSSRPVTATASSSSFRHVKSSSDIAAIRRRPPKVVRSMLTGETLRFGNEKFRQEPSPLFAVGSLRRRLEVSRTTAKTFI